MREVLEHNVVLSSVVRSRRTASRAQPDQGGQDK